METEANLGSVLVIEDEHDIRLMMVRLLKDFVWVPISR